MRLARLACVAVALAGCGGGNGGGTPPPPPPPSGQVATVVITSPSGAQTIGACGTVSFTAQARDAQGNPVTSAAITWQAAPSTTVSFFPTATGNSATGIGTAIGSGSVTAASGTITSTGLTVTVQGAGAGNAADVTATASNTFSPTCVTIGAGGTVNWTFVASPSHNATFTGNKPTGGDIGTTQSTTVSRTFPAAGSYKYTCTLHPGMDGWVVVQ